MDVRKALTQVQRFFLFLVCSLDLFGSALDDVNALAGDFLPGAFPRLAIGGQAAFGGVVCAGIGCGFDLHLADDFSDIEPTGRAMFEFWFIQRLDDGKSAWADFAVAIRFFVLVGGHFWNWV